MLILRMLTTIPVSFVLAQPRPFSNVRILSDKTAVSAARIKQIFRPVAANDPLNALIVF